MYVVVLERNNFMETNINARLFRILFIEKKVNKDNSFYNKYYNYIWPCEKKFKDFIMAKDSTVKLDYAKEIFDYINVFDNILLPSFAMNSIIKLQSTHLSESTDKYFAQDHVIHTINTYILGVYFLFNYEIFNKKVLHNFHYSSFDEQLMNTIKMLRLFSIYHDIGYIFESMIDTKGEIKGFNDTIELYKNINSDIMTQYANKSTAKLLLIICLLMNNKHLFSPKMIFNSNAQWENENRQIFNNDEFINCLDKFQDYNYIDCIQTFHSYKKYFSSLQNLETLIIVHDDRDIPISLITYRNNEITLLAIIESNKNRDIIKLLDKKEYYSNIKLKFFIKNPTNEIKKIFERTNYYEYNNIDDFYRAIPPKIKSRISMVSYEQQLDDAFHTIFSWMNTEFQINDTLFKRRNNLLKQALSDNIKNEIDQYIFNKENLYNKSIKHNVNAIAEHIKRIDVDMIERYANNLSENTDGIFETINYYQESYIKHLKKTFEGNKWDSLDFQNTKTVLRPFLYSNSSNFAENIYSRLSCLAQELGLSITDLKNYKTDYTSCDHGVISSSILFQVSAIYGELLEKGDDNEQILFSYNSNYFDKDNQVNMINTLSQVIFSILLHNIYTKESNKSYGLQYKHDININPFSYFCAFIDSMQKWDRPKQLDYSTTKLPPDHFLNDNFDITILDDYILITCESSYLGKMRKEINNLESFLPGISSLITITESEA